jgi:hypothetical protein
LRGKELNTQAAKARALARVLDRIDPLAKLAEMNGKLEFHPAMSVKRRPAVFFLPH